jgi:hypothetical protein
VSLWLSCAWSAEPKKPDPKRPDVGQWKPPDSPKDTEHWYPEFPGKDVPNDTLINGSFEEPGAGNPAHPKGWAHAEDYCITWMKDPMAPDHGKVIVLDTDINEPDARKRQGQLRDTLEKGLPLPAPGAKSRGAHYGAIGGTYGVSYYSERFKCKPGQCYKVSFDYKGPSGGAKVWVRGWGMFQGEERRRYETIVNCRVKGTGYAHFEQAFCPTRRRGAKDKQPEEGKAPKDDAVTPNEVSVLRVMLYAYWPPGQYYFDNVKVEEINDDEYKRLKAIPADER